MKLGILVISLCAMFLAQGAQACVHRLGVGAGLVHVEEPSSTSFEIGAEYECRMNPFVGIGGFGNHIFADPGVTLLGAPEVFLHPLGGGFYVAASPLVEFGDAVGTHVGARLASRLPIPLGLFLLVPSVAVDFVRGTRIYWISLGIGI
jgi:hypothetical protein